MGIEQINTIEIFKIDDTARISIPSYINIPDDAESRLAVHLIVDYPRDICISYAAYIVGRLHHTSSIVLSNKVDVSTLRRLIAKDLERKEDLLQLYSAWDGILTNTDDNKLRAATLTRRSNPITGSHNPIRDPPSQNQTSY
ncbi:hypothetical protein APHAL10511_008550 [Amanita phalloides]|nr:hypothetical protein APHAL10511_008550 [Amanita phalloides]